jgi:hypothetical protein
VRPRAKLHRSFKMSDELKPSHFQPQQPIVLEFGLPHGMMHLSISQPRDPKSENEEKILPEHEIIRTCLGDVDYMEMRPQNLTRRKWESLRRDLTRLLDLPSTVELLRKLLKYDGLWFSFTSKRFHTFVDNAIRYPGPVNSYLAAIHQRWNFISPAEQEQPSFIDDTTVQLLSGLWPAASLRDRRRLDDLFARSDFLPGVPNPSARAEIKRKVRELKGRVLTFETFLGHELPLLQQASAVELSDQPVCSINYPEFWMSRFLALANAAHSTHTRSNTSRNVYRDTEELFTSCRVCDPTSKVRGIWRGSENLSSFFSWPIAPEEVSDCCKDIPVRMLLNDFLLAFFGPTEAGTMIAEIKQD